MCLLADVLSLHRTDVCGVSGLCWDAVEVSTQVTFLREVTSSVQMAWKPALLTNSDTLVLGVLPVNREPGFARFTVNHPLNRPEKMG